MHCPDCESDLIRLSTKRGPLDWVVYMLGMRAYRCEVCRRRFYHMAGMLGRRYDPNRRAVTKVQDAAAPTLRVVRKRRSNQDWGERFGQWRQRSGERLMRQVIVLTVISVVLLIFFLAISREWGVTR